MIRKPAPLNTTKLRHPKVQNRSYSWRIRHSKFNLKGAPPPAPPTGCHSERSEESLCHRPCHRVQSRARASPVKTCHVYIMASASRVLYIGVTSDLLSRVMEHKEMRPPAFTARYRVTELVYFEVFGDIRIAIAWEKQLKGWLRARKIALIESFNPHWRDLAADLKSPTPNRVSF
jgi:putative endonuclease